MNEKTKSKSKPVYTITTELQEGRSAIFTYSDKEMAETHYEQLQAQGLVGRFAIKNLQRDWRK